MVRVGIVGAGVIGAAHAKSIASIDEAELVGVADVPESAVAQELAEEFSVPFFPGLENMLKYAGIEAVDVCTPSGLHAEQAIRAMRAGRHTVVEKPMVLTIEDCDQMLAVQRDSGVKLTVISQHRFDAPVRYVQSLLEEEELGRPVLANALVPWERTQAYYDQAAWRGTRAMDGGVFLNQAVHYVDLLLWLFGAATSVNCFADTLTHSMETEDVGVMAIRFQSGALGTLSATTAAFPEREPHIEIMGDAGSAVLEGDRLVFLEIRSGKRHVDWKPPGFSRFSSSHTAQLADFIEAIRDDREPLVSGREGRRPVELIVAALESARTGREVSIP